VWVLTGGERGQCEDAAFASLSARITRLRYFVVMTTISDQNISESRPITFASASST
jgi:hypothetical protein